MPDGPLFLDASAYQDDVLALPVADVATAAVWYATHFGMIEVRRSDGPCPSVVMERGGVRIGFAVNGGDPANNGAAIRVRDVGAAEAELRSSGTEVSPRRIDERDGKRFDVFFVVAADGLCYYFHQPIGA